jgi:hypothetical protein
MIFAHLSKHWLAHRGVYSLPSWILCIARSLRVLAYYRDHRALCRLGLYRNHVAGPSNDDLFHHLSHRDYLIKGLSARQRVQAVLSHYRFEKTTFDDAYKDAVYGQGGLPLWQIDAEASRFTIRLEMGSRSNAEGDLSVALVADGKCLHRLSFSWLDGQMLSLDMPVLPFVARNQGRWVDSVAACEAFERAFPNNSASFFCFAAMQGIAQALGMEQVVAIRGDVHMPTTLIRENTSQTATTTSGRAWVASRCPAGRVMRLPCRSASSRCPRCRPSTASAPPSVASISARSANRRVPR